MNQATDLIGQVSVAAAAASDVNAGARTLQSLAWQLSLASDPATIVRTEGEINRQCESSITNVAKIESALPKINQKSSIASVEAVRHSFERAQKMLTGTDGVAATINSELEEQQRATALFAAALASIRSIAQTGSNRARDAEGAQENAVNRIGQLSGATFWIVGIIAGVALFSGSLVGRNVRAGILNAENDLHSADEMTHVLERVKQGADDMRQVLEKIRATAS